MHRKQGEWPIRTQAGVFQTTCWAQLDMARTQDSLSRRPVIEALTDRYWRPVYYFLLHKGHGQEEALDLTQGFFQEIVLGKGLFEKADPFKGRFRTYLLTALMHYVAAEHRKKSARKRTPLKEVLHLDAAELRNLSNMETATPPDQVFIYAWAADLLLRAMAEVETECRSDGRDVHWQVFYERVARPILEEKEAPDLGEVCRRFAIEDEKTASNMVITVKRRFRAAIQRLLGETLASDADIDDELNDLVTILSDHGSAA
jgi:hypothetical protein